ncbi:MAG TPA: phage tail sheath C-terminal domain-containing protein [Candidatus Methylomirabilis sp.]|nr:phage tail sheath C-terminal domain-containing protein [Candidatus Methylomirabilis sp.]
MPQYLSPGVYVEEVPSAVKPIAGVGTSTAGFIGLVSDAVTMPFRPGRPLDPSSIVTADRYALAPAGQAQLITSWVEFVNAFGDVQAGNTILANAVYGFFNNGGTRCWVTRVTSLIEDATVTPAVDQVEQALAEFEAIDEIAIVAVPVPTNVGAGNDAANLARRVAIRGMVLSHCENLQDRFGVLDGEETVAGALVPQGIYPNAGGTAMGATSVYGAVYFPWIDTSGTGNFVPPSGHMAGIYARVDGERGVHKAPANVTVRGALDVKYRVSKAQQDGLNPQGVNVIRQFNGNITVWGARTIGGDANLDFKYVNVRRLFNFLRESIDEGTQWVVFEPNTPELWAKITRNVSAFLTNVWRAGALFGTTPQEAFYVKCDAETNPPEVRDLGQVVTEIGVAVVKPAEFVIFRISQWSGPGK